MNVNCGNPRRMPGLSPQAEKRPAGGRVWRKKAASPFTKARDSGCSEKLLHAGVRLRLLDLLHHGGLRRALAQNRLASRIRARSGVNRRLAQRELLRLSRARKRRR